MLFHNASNIKELRIFLNHQVKRYNDLLVQLAEKQAEDAKDESGYFYGNQEHFFSWNGIDLIVYSVFARNAADLLRRIDGMDDTASIPDEYKKETMKRIKSEMRINSRSSSMSSNIAEDADRAFWVELANVIL